MEILQRKDIVITNPQAAYFPGQVIEGEFHLYLTGDMEMTGIRVKCCGKGHVFWKTGSENSTGNTFEAFEDYLDTAVDVFGYGSDNDVVLRQGSHVFPFQFVLPAGLPSSFEGMYRCSVRYWITGCVDKRSAFHHRSETPFTVSAALDLNTIDGAGEPVQGSASKTVCCLCCESGPMEATLRLDRTGYVPGEAIICDAEVNDETGRGAHSSTIKLIQKATYRTHGSSKRQEHVECARIQHGPLSPWGSDTFQGERLVVPNLPPSYMPGCKLIDIAYTVKLSVDVVDTPFDVDVTIDVIIGTIPLQSVAQQHVPESRDGVVTNQPSSLAAPVDLSLPPPSYRECMLEKGDTPEDVLGKGDKPYDVDTQYAGTPSLGPADTNDDGIIQPPAEAPDNTALINDTPRV